MIITATVNSRSSNKILKNFKKYPVSVQKEIRKEISETAVSIETRAKNNSPVKTGRLRSSIHSKLKNNENYPYSDNEGRSFIGTLLTPFKGIGALVGTNVEYAAMVEYGEIETKTGQQPFLGPAATAEKPKFIQNITRAVRRTNLK